MRADLNDQLIQDTAANAREPRINITDVKVKGLAVDVRKNGATFYFRITRQGRTTRVSLGHFPCMNVATARHICLEKKAELRKSPDQEALQESQELRVDEYYEQHFLQWCKVFRKTYSSHHSLYKNHLKTRFGAMLLSEVSNKHVFRFIHDLAEAGYSKSFINKSVQHFRSALKKADELCDADVHPSLHRPLSLPQAPSKKERYLNEGEARRLRDYIDANSDDTVVLLLGFLLYTGARRHEAMNAEWQHINFEAKSWYVPITKSGKPRYVVLNEKAIDIAKRARSLQRENFGRQLQWMFVNPQSNRPYRCIFYKWQKIRGRLGLEDMRIHDLRHSYASTLVNNGATLYEVQKLLGHSRSATTERYAHLADQTLHRAASLIDKAYK